MESTAFLFAAGTALALMAPIMTGGVGGFLKNQSDTVGDQYNPQSTSGTVTHTVVTNTVTQILPVDGGDGYWTSRLDMSDSVIKKDGSNTTPF